MKCKHIWVYANRIYTTMPEQRDRICSQCGKEECVVMGIKIPFEETYTGLVLKFDNAKTSESQGGKN